VKTKTTKPDTETTVTSSGTDTYRVTATRQGKLVTMWIASEEPLAIKIGRGHEVPLRDVDLLEPGNQFSKLAKRNGFTEEQLETIVDEFVQATIDAAI
jgi:hypothetical protein